MKPTEYNFPTVVRHVYDVDAFETLDKLKEKYLKNIDFVPENLKDLEFIKLEEELLIKQFKEDDFDLSEHQKHRSFIIPSNYNIYCTYLGYRLLTIDVYKIEPLLSYQSVLFMGNYYAAKDNFIGLVEFLTYEFVKARLLPFEKKRLEKIVNWLERNRVFLLNKAYNDINGPIINENESEINKDGTEIIEPIIDIKEEEVSEKSIKEEINVIANETDTKTTETTNIAKESRKTRIIKMDAQFANILCEKLKHFFENEEQLLYNLIIKNEFTKPLLFNGQDNQLAELFKRLRYNAKIDVKTYKSLAEWITECFVTVNDKGKVEPLNFSSIYKVLKDSEREPPKTKRILLEIAQFIIPNDRKNDSPKK